MGTKNNVNPDHYKEDGREKPGQDIAHERNKQNFARAEAEKRKRNAEGGSEFIPPDQSQDDADKP
jgi:hypothetical protein